MRNQTRQLELQIVAESCLDPQIVKNCRALCFWSIWTGWCFGTWLLFLYIYWECHHPNWRAYVFNIFTYFSEGLVNHQPVKIWPANSVEYYMYKNVNDKSTNIIINPPNSVAFIFMSFAFVTVSFPPGIWRRPGSKKTSVCHASHFCMYVYNIYIYTVYMFIYTVYMFIYFWYVFVILLAFLILGVIEKHVLFAFPKPGVVMFLPASSSRPVTITRSNKWQNNMTCPMDPALPS